VIALAEYIHEVVITSLKLGRTQYEYQVRIGDRWPSKWSETFEFRSRPFSPDDPITIGFFADQDVIRWGRDGEGEASIIIWEPPLGRLADMLGGGCGCPMARLYISVLKGV
jgi:hypothetical protein